MTLCVSYRDDALQLSCNGLLVLLSQVLTQKLINFLLGEIFNHSDSLSFIHTLI